MYWNFFLDFGPLNLGQLYRFCTKLNAKLETLSEQEVICFYSAPTQAQRANAIFLICAWQVLHGNRTPAQAFYGFSLAKDNHDDDGHDEEDHHQEKDGDHHQDSSIPPHVPLTSIGKATLQPLLPFHDASPCACTYELNLMHCLEGLQKAKRFNFFNWETFNVDEYEHFEQVEVRTVIGIVSFPFPCVYIYIHMRHVYYSLSPRMFLLSFHD